jgi:thiol-disulfide isomerase/thioredoxin
LDAVLQAGEKNVCRDFGVTSARAIRTPMDMNMKTQIRNWTTAMLALTASATLAWGAAREPKESTLKVGDAAPKLQVAKWVQGEPVKAFERDKAYIVEFWATWCGPCRVSIPHLNEIHTKFKDKGLVVIGQDVWEQNVAAVEPFIKKMGDKMTYRVALDEVPEGENTKGKMAETWMEAAGQNGIPAAFLVDKQGKIAWIGHPMELKESVIEQVLAGTYDLKKAAAEQNKMQQNRQQLTQLGRKLSTAMQEEDWEKAQSTLDEIEKLLPEDQRAGLAPARFRVFAGKGDCKSAFKLAGELSDANKDNAMLQNQIAWDLATNEKIKDRDLDLLEKIATRANDAAQGKDPAILDTLARVLFMNGKKAKAIELQEKAVKLADGTLKDSLQTTLDSYKEGKLPKAN